MRSSSDLFFHLGEKIFKRFLPSLDSATHLPVIVGKRALPALDLSMLFGPWLDAILQHDDMVMGFGPPEGDLEVQAALVRAHARGAMTFALPGDRGSYAFRAVSLSADVQARPAGREGRLQPGLAAPQVTDTIRLLEDRMAQKPIKGHLLLLTCLAVVFFTSMAPRRARATTRMIVDRFNQAFNRHDPDALALLLTDDTVFEDTSPAPDGKRIEGKAAVVAFWREWFARNTDAQFDAEEIIVSGDRAVVRWVYRKVRNGQPWHLRGVDIFTVRDGKVAAKLAYVKG